MKKRVWLVLSFLLISALTALVIQLFTEKYPSRKSGFSERNRLVYAQSTGGNKKEDDAHLVQLLKAAQETLDDWLKALNDRIERQDITRLEVRFLEIVRSFLEWIKDKVDSQLESLKMREEEKKKGGKLFRDTHQRLLLTLEAA
jgi:hypothetical protein